MQEDIIIIKKMSGKSTCSCWNKYPIDSVTKFTTPTIANSIYADPRNYENTNAFLGYGHIPNNAQGEANLLPSSITNFILPSNLQ